MLGPNQLFISTLSLDSSADPQSPYPGRPVSSSDQPRLMLPASDPGALGCCMRQGTREGKKESPVAPTPRTCQGCHMAFWTPHAKFFVMARNRGQNRQSHGKTRAEPGRRRQIKDGKGTAGVASASNHSATSTRAPERARAAQISATRLIKPRAQSTSHAPYSGEPSTAPDRLRMRNPSR